VILDHKKELLGASIAQDHQWRFPPIPKVPEKFIHAITRYEDRRFFFHPGVDPLAVIRSLWLNIKYNRVVSGASTITMQVIRLSRQGRPRTIMEKIIEMVLALRLELSKSKNEILNLFASHAPFGGNVVGIEAASWRYFGRAPSCLSWAETAILAVLPNSPALIHPGRNRKKLLEKRNQLLTLLYEEGIIDPLTSRLAKLEPLPPKPLPIPHHAPHLLDRIKKNRYFGKANSKRDLGGVQNNSRFRTTLIKSLQLRTTDLLKLHHKKLLGNGIHNAAALVLDVDTGHVLAYVGNVLDLKQANHGNHVDVVTASRSTGSILKPLLYAGLMQSGEILPTSLVPDIPTRIGGFAPQNYTHTYQGAVPASMALARSLNVPAVRMLRSYGTDRFYALLKWMGMTTLHRPARDYGLSLILGGAEGTLWDITGIYAGMARCVNRFSTRDPEANPVYFAPSFIPEKENENVNNHGKNYKKRKTLSRVENPLDAAACYLTMEAMSEVIRPGVESAWHNFLSSRKIAWKTGTSYGFRDGWAIGITPMYAVGVWTGNADGEGRPGLTGIGSAAPLLFDIFGLLEASQWFPRPEAGLIDIEVCAKSGYRAGPDCGETKIISAPLSGQKVDTCPYCRIVHCDDSHKWRVHSECQRVSDIRSVKWFVLPTVLEWYFKKRHSDYRPLPPFRTDCIETMEGTRTASLTMIYPENHSMIYIPMELSGRRGKMVFEAAHRDVQTTIHWHLDDIYLGSTRDIHQMALSPSPGRHVLTLVDANGELIRRTFNVLAKK